ncbi:MAG: hypothetical protein ACREB1_07355 [Sphingomicrobium sp.]
MPNRKRDSEGRFASGSFIDAMRDRPYTTAAAAAGVAAAGAFLWAKRDQIGDLASSGMDKFSELKSQRMGSGQSQSEIAEEALTLKETGRKSRGPRGPVAQQDIKAGMASG